MTSLRILKMTTDFHMNILDCCTFKLDSFEGPYMNSYHEFLPKFLNSQPRLKYIITPILRTYNAVIIGGDLPTQFNSD
jgi:hypothetical protein